MMKFRFAFLAVLLAILPIVSLAQVTPSAVITGNATGIVGATTTTYPISLQAQVVGCGPQVPLVIGGGSVVTNTYKVNADSSLNATITAFGNDILSCGNQTLTLYAVTWLINGLPAAPTASYRVNQGTTCNISDGTCLPINFIPPIISKAAGKYCPADKPLLNGFNPDYTPVCTPATNGASFNSPFPNVVVSTSPTQSRAGTVNDIVNLWGIGCTGFLKSDGTCAVSSSGGAAGSQYQLQINGGAGTFGASTVTTDAATLSSLTIPKGLLNISTDYSNLAIPAGTDYTPQVPTYIREYSNGQKVHNDFYGAYQADATINGTDSYILESGVESNPDYAAVFHNVYVNSPIQGGGFYSDNVFANSTGDTVYRTGNIHCRGITENFHEGCEIDRRFSGFDYSQIGGTVALNGTDAQGREKMQITVDLTKYGGDNAGTNNILIDLSKVQSPAGNATSIATYTDSRFKAVIVDGTLNSALTALMPGTFHQTTVISGADMQKYNTSCPSTVIGNWGTTNPYTADYTGQGSHTQAQCVIVGSTAGMSTGTVIGFWGGHDTWEITKVTTVVDATHIIVPLNAPHDAGELITWGPGLGYGLSTPGSTIPAGTLNSGIKTQYADVHITFPIIGYNAALSQLIVYTNSSATNNQAELKLNIYAGLTPTTPAVYTPTVVGGVVTAVTSNVNNYLSGSNVSGYLNQLPPPTLTFGGTGSCTTLPTFSYSTQDSTSGYTLNLVTGGSGCPANLSITPQASYSNPILLYPLTRTYRIQDPITQKTNTGFVLTHVLAVPSVWTNGDTVETTPHWNQYIAGNVQEGASPLVKNSSRFGPGKTLGYLFAQNGPNNDPTDLEYRTNQTPSWYYWGDASTGYQASADPAKALYARGVTPTIMGIGGAHQGIYFRTPPSLGLGSTAGANLFRIGCIAEGADGLGNMEPCLRPNPIYPKFNLFWVNNAFNAVHTTFSVDLMNPLGPTWNFADRLTNGGKLVCLVDGTNCQTPHDYSLKISSTASSYSNDTQYYIGSANIVTTNTTPYLVVPTTCAINNIQFDEIASGSGPTTEGVAVELLNLTASTTILSTSFSWGGSNQNNYGQSGLSGPTITAGDHLQIHIHTPFWATPPPSTIAVSATIYCK